MKNINKILETLSLSSSDTREDTLKSIAVTTLNNSQIALGYSELLTKVEQDFGLQLYELEFKQILGILFDEGKIVVSDEKYQLDDQQRSSLKTQEFKLRSADTTRYNNFKTFVELKYKNFSGDDIKTLWQLFREYIYECFYFYGVKANQLISPKYQVDTDVIFTNTDILYSLTTNINNDILREALKYVVDNFSNYATAEDIDFLDELGQKTLAFTSLGLDPNLAKDSFENKLVDWVLFLDTNFLFSILDLHNNVEDDACKELLKLVSHNLEYIKIEFRFTELTLQELKNKKDDFVVLDQTLTRSAINALLRTEDIDDFSRKFYTKLLNNPAETVHPSEVIDLASITLPNLQINLYRTKVIVDSFGQNYLDTKIQEYQRFINDQNDYRNEFSRKNGGRQFKEIYRNDPQMEHDITLREVILARRFAIKKKEFKIMNEAKYFGATLDELLLKFDNYQRKKGNDQDYPTFFRPSYLLNKLVKVLPVKTADYKKAFIKAVSSRGFNRDVRKSHDIIRIVSYLKSQGIDNEDVILNLINEQVFLERFKSESSKEGFEMGVFIESELNILFRKTNSELQIVKKELDQRTSEKIVDLEENKKLNDKVFDLSNQLNLYQSQMEKIHTRIKSLESNERKEQKQLVYQGKIDFYTGEKDAKIKDLEKNLKDLELQQEAERKKKFEIDQNEYVRRMKFKWRLPTWILAITVVLLTATCFVYLLYKNNWSWNVTIEICKTNTLISIAITCIGLIFNYVFIKLLYDKTYNHSNIKSFEERQKNKYLEKLK